MNLAKTLTQMRAQLSTRARRQCHPCPHNYIAMICCQWQRPEDIAVGRKKEGLCFQKQDGMQKGEQTFASYLYVLAKVTVLVVVC